MGNTSSGMGIVLGVVREELPAHSVVYRTAAFQVRRYAPSVVAECGYTGRWGDADSDGSPFMQLARYIGVFGKAENASQRNIAMTAPVLITPEKISMTAPVLISPGDSTTGDTMSFVLPASKYSSVAEAPVPTNPNIHLRQLPERDVAVRSFSWSLRAERAREHLARLISDLDQDGKYEPKRTASGDVDFQAAGYNPPFTLPWLKTNEIMVSVVEKK